MDSTPSETPPVEAPRKVRYEPLHNGVLIEEDSADEKTAGGIILPQSARSKMNQGVVKAVGKGLIIPATGERIPMDVKVGMRVTWQQYGGAEIKVDGKPYILVRESEINGILHGDAPKPAPAPEADPAKEAEAKPPQPLNETAPAPRALPAPVTKADLFADVVAESASELTATVVADKPRNLPLPGEGLPEPVPLPKRSG